MNENFWGKMSDEYLKDNPEPPALTNEMLAHFEQRVGLKLPKTLIDLLLTKNGGLIRNTDFRFNGKDYQVTYVKSVTLEDSYNSIRTYENILDDPNAEEAKVSLQKKAGDLSKLLLMAEALDGPDAFVLNYSDFRNGEPTVWLIALEYGEEARAKRIANSLTEFIGGQYSGDETPIVSMKEAEQYQLLAAGGYSGQHEVGDSKVETAWKICLNGAHLLVFQEEDWGLDKSVIRMEMNRAQFNSSSGLLDLLFGFYLRFALYRLGKQIGANLSQAANTKKLSISKKDAPLKPRCFDLTFHTHTLGDELTEDSWIRVRRATMYEGRWKNSESKVWNDSISSAREEELLQALKVITKLG